MLTTYTPVLLQFLCSSADYCLDCFILVMCLRNSTFSIHSSTLQAHVGESKPYMHTLHSPLTTDVLSLCVDHLTSPFSTLSPHRNCTVAQSVALPFFPQMLQAYHTPLSTPTQNHNHFPCHFENNVALFFSLLSFIEV